MIRQEDRDMKFGEDNMELKKSYKGFLLWMLVFVVTMFGCSLLPIENGAILTRMVMNVCVLNIVLLAFIIYKTEYVYWYNGTEYEQAVEAGSERRKEFAWKHLMRFGIFALIYLAISMVAQLVDIPYGVDIAVATVGLVITAFSTNGIQL